MISNEETIPKPTSNSALKEQWTAWTLVTTSTTRNTEKPDESEKGEMSGGKPSPAGNQKSKYHLCTNNTTRNAWQKVESNA